MSNQTPPLRRAIALLGGMERLGRALVTPVRPKGVTKAGVGLWLKPGGQVPADVCPLIERITLRQVTCEELRPDVDWGYLRGTRQARQART